MTEMVGVLMVEAKSGGVARVMAEMTAVKAAVEVTAMTLV